MRAVRGRAFGTGSSAFHSHDNPISREQLLGRDARPSPPSLTAAERSGSRRTANARSSIARPPGHHAERAARRWDSASSTRSHASPSGLRELPGIERVFILDWDVHHGNGTQALFEDRDDVYYASIHRFPFYPGTGAAYELGFGKGRGFTKNIPLSGGTGDTAYIDSIESSIVPVIDDYRPDAILVSAGFDAHWRDPLGGMRVSEQRLRAR